MKKEQNTDATRFEIAKEKVFALVKDKDDKVNICLGGYAVSEKKFDTFQQANNYINSKPYELLINVCAVILKKTKDNDTKD